MKGKRLLLAITIVFIVFMTTLTFTARHIRNHLLLPNVTAERVGYEAYDTVVKTMFGEEVITTGMGLAIPKSKWDGQGAIFLIETRLKNGEQRSFVKTVTVSVKGENEDSYIIDGGVSRSDVWVVECDRALEDGDEVWVRG